MADRTILVPLDGSKASLRALPYAVGLTKLGGTVKIVLMTVLMERSGDAEESGENGWLETNEWVTRRQLQRVARRARMLGASAVNVTTVHGAHADEEILRVAAEHGADVIVMGTHGRSGLSRALIGSVTTKVVQHTRIPCLLVPPGPQVREVRFERAILATDGSTFSLAALPMASALVESGVEVTVLEVVPPSAILGPFGIDAGEGYVPYGSVEDLLAVADEHVQGMAARLPSGAVKTETILGPPATAIVECAQARKADLILMTTHARSAAGRLLWGSVTDRVVRTANVPVMVVRPPEE